MSQGNGPMPLQVGIRITRKSTNVVLHNSSTPESESARKKIQGEHPVGAHWFSTNGKTTATTQTKPGCQMSAGLCIPDSMADP